MQHLATSINLPAAFLVCLRLQADTWTVLCVSSAASLRAASWYSDSLCSPSPSPLLPPWHSHTGKYDRQPLWLPRLPDRSDRRRQQHSEEDYAQSLLWWVQSHLLGARKTLVTKRTNINNYSRQRAAALTNSPSLPFNIKRDMCRILRDEFKWGSTFLKAQHFKMSLCDFHSLHTNLSCSIYWENMQRNGKLFISSAHNTSEKVMFIEIPLKLNPGVYLWRPDVTAEVTLCTFILLNRTNTWLVCFVRCRFITVLHRNDSF